MPPSSTLVEAVDALRALVKTLSKRKDVLMTKKTVGRKGFRDVDILRVAASNRLPAELLDLLELMNGIDVAWHWVGGEGGGMRIPTAAGWFQYHFQTDEENYNDFGPGKVSAFFDGFVGERATWLVADGPDDRPNARLLFAEQGEGDAGTLAAPSIADYLRQAVASGLLDFWQRADEADDDFEEQLARLAAPVAVPPRIRPGVRVHGRFFSEGCRGKVLETLDLPEADISRYLTQKTWALVRYDVGLTRWTPTEQLRALPKKPDLYEQYYPDLRQLVRDGHRHGWASALRTMGLLWGPLTSYSAGTVLTASGAAIPAALLMPLPLADALDVMQQIVAGLEPLHVTLPAELELTEAERKLAFNQYDWRRYGWQARWTGIVEQLLCGLMLRLLQEPPAGRAAIAPADLDALEARASYAHAGRYFHTMRELLAGSQPQFPEYSNMRDELPGYPSTY